jgi:hypothetical protein
VVPTHKQKDKRKCENYTGICITDSCIKIIGNIIKTWIERDYQGTEEQSRFTKGCSTTHHIFTAGQILDKYNIKQQDTDLIFFKLLKS